MPDVCNRRSEALRLAIRLCESVPGETHKTGVSPEDVVKAAEIFMAFLQPVQSELDD